MTPQPAQSKLPSGCMGLPAMPAGQRHDGSNFLRPADGCGIYTTLYLSGMRKAHEKATQPSPPQPFITNPSDPTTHVAPRCFAHVVCFRSCVRVVSLSISDQVSVQVAEQASADGTASGRSAAPTRSCRARKNQKLPPIM